MPKKFKVKVKPTTKVVTTTKLVKRKKHTRHHLGFQMNPNIKLNTRNPFPNEYYAEMTYGAFNKIQSDGTPDSSHFGTPFGGSTGVPLNDYAFFHTNSVPGYSQVENIWQYAVVYGATVKIQFDNVTHQGSTIGIQVANNSTISGYSIQNQLNSYALERADTKVLLVEDDYRIPVFKKYIPIHKLLGITKKQLMTEDRYRSTCASGTVASPADKCSMIMSLTSPASASYVSFGMELTYHIKFFQKLQC